MPVVHGKDKDGKFFRYGKSGKKYYYKTEIGKKRAKSLAMKQGRAIKSRQYGSSLVVKFY